MAPNYKLFTIRINPIIKPKRIPKKNRASRRCLAVVIKNDGKFYAKIPYNNSEDCDEFYILPFTEESLSLKGKDYVFSTKLDEYGKRVCVIRDSVWCKLHPGIPEQYDVLIENILICGYMVRIDGVLHFKYEHLIAFTPYAEHINEVRINLDEPLMTE